MHHQAAFATRVLDGICFGLVRIAVQRCWILSRESYGAKQPGKLGFC